ncbi:alkaline phosphatase D family protein [Christiangramia sabulilitoris]|uniref:Alkaline phosphatase family protein n=1 Tax=Christiangramia sabulilitoris TaxID=2583991 RepID=A0A550I7D9_9FLAO|nr:alkaline phosphatase D family protein [Christiangramia sabulilitoris]TRO66884.1 alkaline phosphatase family protein [Christiangramia sabulilitoris]
MKIVFKLFPLFLFLLSCGSSSRINPENEADFVIAFGSCNREDAPQPLWSAILKNNPDVFLWGGDNIYSDTDNAKKMKADYLVQKQNKGYQKVLNQTTVLATWDDHDYGLNDGGKQWHLKEASQQLFLDFMDVPANSTRRSRVGVYYAEEFETPKGSIKVILLDTRYFRDELKENLDPEKRYAPSEGTILGEQQWAWLEEELNNSEADFNVILSSIQILSAEHGFEKWANFPSEVEKLKELLISSKARNVILLSGDRHISEFSKTRVEGLDYPLVDFTSSGLTHTYVDFDGEPNRYRVGEVVKYKSFGLLKFDLSKKKVLMEMRGENNKLQQDYLVEFQ